MPHANSAAVWSLRSHLSALLVSILLLTLMVVGGVVLAYGVPRIERDSQAALQHEVREMAGRMELLLRTRQTWLHALGALQPLMDPHQVNGLLDKGVRHGGNLPVVYRISPEGRIVAAGLPPDLQVRRADLLGSDLSSNSLFLAVGQRSGVVWSGRYRSALTGAVTAGFAYRESDAHVLIAEVPIASLLSTVQLAAGARSSSIWVVDQSGEIIAQTGEGDEVGKLNIRNWPLMQGLLQSDGAAQTMRLGDQDFQVAAARSDALGWHFVARAPGGLAHPEVRGLVLYVVVAFAACVAIGLLMAPFWASRLVRPLQQIVVRAGQATAGDQRDLAWPRGSVAEFNRLSSDLESMALALRERELTSLAIFNAAPVAMTVLDHDNGNRVLDVNQAWCRDFRRDRTQVLGLDTWEIGIWKEPDTVLPVLQRIAAEQVPGEIWMLRGDGSPLLVQLFTRKVKLASQSLLIGVSVDIGPIRRFEDELRVLNQQLEERVEQRTADLAASNDALSHAVEQLRATQDELVRADTMAALGKLVAGVAHELNTPLGNGVMAVSAVAEAVQCFHAGAAAGIKRADLLQLVDSVEQGVDMAGRNLRRAADLVQSFKQVAVDQTSSQRRRFELHEVVTEIVVSLGPSLRRTPYRVEVDVPETGLRLDSYPGALGQALANLVQNAVLHGFDGRDHGTVTISARQDPADGRIVLRVADDGRGIPAAVLPRIFDAFVTTRQGRGGTGLGLHVSFNAVEALLGGTLKVHSIEGEGACFEMWLPAEAPRGEVADALHCEAD